jgi:hypothetical protein
LAEPKDGSAANRPLERDEPGDGAVAVVMTTSSPRSTAWSRAERVVLAS